MKEPIIIEIAGVRFGITCSNTIVLKKPGPVYKHFLEKVNTSHTSADIQIHVKLENMPVTDHLTRIFESDSAWSMFQADDDYFLSFNSKAYGDKPVCLAKFDSHCNEVVVYCSSQLVTEKAGRAVVANPFSYPLDQLLFMYYLAQNQGSLIHAAGLVINNRGFIFPGRSGAGKSTLSRNLICQEGIDILSDDRIAVRKTTDGFDAYGTPWPGEAGIAINRRVPLVGIFFIRHALENKVIEFDSRAGIRRLLPVTSIPWYDRNAMPKILDFCEDLISRTPTYELSFKPGAEVVDVLRQYF
jgi:hypothetical protein